MLNYTIKLILNAIFIIFTFKYKFIVKKNCSIFYYKEYLCWKILRIIIHSFFYYIPIKNLLVNRPPASPNQISPDDVSSTGFYDVYHFRDVI